MFLVALKRGHYLVPLYPASLAPLAFGIYLHQVEHPIYLPIFNRHGLASSFGEHVVRFIGQPGKAQ
jgi:hypothetical protein